MANERFPLSGKVVAAEPLVGVERDEIVALVSRIKRADAKAREPLNKPEKMVKVEDIAWAEEWQLPKEVLDFFEIERAA